MARMQNDAEAQIPIVGAEASQQKASRHVDVADQKRKKAAEGGSNRTTTTNTRRGRTTRKEI